MLVKNMKLCDIDMIYEQVRVSGISKIELSMEELELVVNTLIYELRIEEVSKIYLKKILNIFSFYLLFFCYLIGSKFCINVNK